MRIFTCSNCDNTVHFENVRCVHCGKALAYFPELGLVGAIEPIAASAKKGEPLTYRALMPNAKHKLYRLCANSLAYGVCNSVVPAGDPEELCEACRLNDVIPDVDKPGALAAWQSLERSKRRLLYGLRELKLPIETRTESPDYGLQFAFRHDSADGTKAFTGHSDGLITINVAEADDPFREKLRQQLGERYRTVLGHFRHEIGHYYWDRLIRATGWLAPYRALFGDEASNYAAAVARHYGQPAPRDWPVSYVSAYATMHPWEDWAETWAHYMHIVDTLGTARSYGLQLRPRPEGGAREPATSARALDFGDFDALLHAWVPVTVALNSLNRSMGLTDPYPFVLSEGVTRKLRFVHEVIHHWNARTDEQAELIAWWLRDAAEHPELAPVVIAPESESDAEQDAEAAAQ